MACFKIFVSYLVLGFKIKGIGKALIKYGIIGICAGLISGIAFYVGLRPFDATPTVWKVLIEGMAHRFLLVVKKN